MNEILVIIDNRESLASIMALVDVYFPACTIVSAESCKQGLNLANSENPDLILLDSSIQDMQCYEACEEFRLNYETQNIPIIILTTNNTDKNVKMKCLNSGADTFLSTPIEPADFIAQIKVMIRIKASESRLASEKDEVDRLVKESNYQLQESEKRYKDLYNNAPLPYQSLDGEGFVIEVNPAWLNTLEYTREEIIGRNFKEFIHPDNMPGFYKNFALLMSTGHVQDVKYKLLHKKGYYLSTSFADCVRYNSDGSLKQTYCSFQDITNRLIAEEALERSEEKFRLIAENSIDCIWTLDLELRFTYLSPALNTMFGYNPTDFIGTHLSIFFNPGEYKKILKIVVASLKDTSIRNELTFETKVLDSNQNEIDVEVSGHVLIDKAGKKIGLQGAAREITVRKLTEKTLKESEERFKRLFYDLGDAVFVCKIGNRDYGRILEVNPAAEEQTGYAHADLLKLNIADDLVVSSDLTISNLELNQKLIRGESFTTTEQKKKKDGTLYWVDVIVTPIDFNGEKACLSINHDITQLKLTELALQKSEKKYRVLFEESKDSSLIIKNGIFIACNNATLKLLQYSNKKDVLLKSPAELSPLYQLDGQLSTIKSEQIINKVLEIGSHRFEWYHTKSNGEIFPVEVMLTAISIEPENQILHTVWRDITIRKQAELALKSSEEKYRTIIEKSPIGIVHYNINGEITECNQQFIEIIGSSRDRLIGFNMLKDVLDQKLVQAVNASLELGEAFYEGLYNSVTADKSTYVRNIFKGLRNKDNEIVAGLGIVENVTERVNSEKEIIKLSKAVDQSPSIFIITNLEGNIEYVNPRFSTVTGYTLDEVLGHKASILNSDKSDSSLYLTIWENISKRKEWRGEIQSHKKNGELYWESASISPIYDTNGDTSNYIIVAEDISERKLAEEQIKKNLQEKSTLLQELYHRTKNNMQVISSLLHIESMRSKNETIKKSFKELNNKIKSMALVHEKLYKSQDLSKINLKTYIEDLIPLLYSSNALSASQVNFSLSLEKVFVMIDAAIPLGLILNELISNSLKHAFNLRESGIISIKLSVNTKGLIELRVSDNGVGLSQNFNLKNSDKMGLNTVIAMIEYQLHGEVTYQNNAGLEWLVKFRNDRHKRRV